MTQPLGSRRPATYDDLCRVPDHLVAEIVEGELYASPRPALPHAAAASVLQANLHVPFSGGRGGPGGWWILFEPELHLRDDVLVPDIAGWRRERLTRVPDAAFLTLAPDWVCEVVSPSTERLDRLKKLHVYAREGVPHVWLVNPLAQLLEAYALESGRWVLIASHGADEIVRVPPFDAVALELVHLWPTPPEQEQNATRERT